MNIEDRMPFLKHIEELRSRIIYSAIAILIFFIPSYMFSYYIFDFLMLPIRNNLPADSYMIFTRPAEGFITYLKVAIFSAFVFSFPFILLQFWKFVSPALYKHEKKIAIPFIVFGTIFFITGAAFCYFIVAPQGLQFLLGEYSSEYVRAFPSIKEALSFLMSLMIAFGIVFEFPLVIFVLSRMGLVTSGWLREKRKYAIFFSAILAAAITPADAISMMFMLIPLFVFYEVGIIVAAVVGKKRKEQKDEEGKEEEEEDESG